MRKMKISISRWSLQGKLALAAALLGALAVFGDPYGGGAVTLRPQELATLVSREADHVTVQELADWLIQGRADYRLIDLRNAEDYAAYHIPGAENVPLAALPEQLPAKNETIVLYSDGGIHAAQAWFLLAAQGYGGAYFLLGGLDEWKDRILFPTLPAGATPDQLAAFEKDRQVSAHFGGTPRIGAEPGGATATAALPPALPKVQAPAAAPATGAAKKKKKEGC
jgi:rhodanese-related sulfurtransferase